MTGRPAPRRRCRARASLPPRSDASTLPVSGAMVMIFGPRDRRVRLLRGVAASAGATGSASAGAAATVSSGPPPRPA